VGQRLRFRDVLAVSEFRAMWAAELLSVAGDQLARVALAVLVYERTSSAAWTALTYALTFVPAVLGGLVLSGLADRYPRRAVLVWTDLVRAGLAGVLAVPFLPLPALLAVVFVLTLAGAPAKAAQLALLPQVLPGPAYTVGLALRTMTCQSAQLFGFAGGGVVLLVITPHAALGLNAATFVAAAVLVFVGVRPRPAPVAGRAQSDNDRGVVALIWRDRRLRGLIGICWLVGFVVVPEGLAAPYAAGLGGAAFAVGVLMAADPAGSVLGAWALTQWAPARLHDRLIAPLAVAAGLPLIFCVLRPGLLGSALLWGLSGALSTAYLVLAQAAFIQRVPDERRGAVAGLATSGLYACQGLAILAAGLIADQIGPSRTVALAGATGATLAVVIGLSWLRARHEPTPQQEQGLGGRDAETAVVRSPCSASAAPPPTEPAVVDPQESAAGASRAAALP